MIPKIKYIMAYQRAPISVITHSAPVARIELFSEPARPIVPIPLGDAPSGFMQGPRYTTYEQLLKAKKVTELISRM